MAPSDPGATPPDQPDDSRADSPDGDRDGGPDSDPRTRLPCPDPATRGGGGSGELAVMRDRLAAMAAPRDDDDPEVAALRAVLRDERLMTQVKATVEEWPPLTEEQQAALAALLTPRPRPPG